MASFRFIHAADIHLDSPLRGLEGMEGSAAGFVHTATRKALENLVAEAVENAVDFVIIAGDIYDGDWKDYQTGLFFVAQMGKLARAGIPVFLLYGNHDAESQITKRLTLPDNVKTFSARKPETFILESIGAALHGQGYAKRDVTENLAASYPTPVRGAFNIGILHTALGGMDGHANYAPCALAELLGRGYDYWALGHVHQGRVISESPRIVFPGNLQGRHIRETGPKGALLVTVEDNEITALDPLYTDVVRWELIKVDAGGCADFTDVYDRMRSAIEEAAGRSEGRLLASRIELYGPTATHDHLITSRESLLAEARSAALALGDGAAWVERVILSTEPVRDDDTAAGEIPRDLCEILGGAAGDTDLHSLLKTELSEIILKLPPELRNGIDDLVLSAAAEADYPRLVKHVGEYLNALLRVKEY